MRSLALKSLIYEWRRFAPAMVAVAFSGLLVLLQAGIILGIFSLSSQYVTRSAADLWIGYPGVQSLDLGRPLNGPAEIYAWMNPHIRRLEPFLWGSGDWRTRSQGMVNVYIVGIDPGPDGLALSGALTPAERAALSEPDTALVDEADLHKLQTGVGQTAEVNGRYLRIVGVTRGLRALGGVNVIASLATTRRLDPAAGPQGRVTYLLAKLDDPKASGVVAAALNVDGATRGFEALAVPAFARRTTLFWLVESGAGVAFLFGSIVAILVAGVITSQTLSAAVAGSIREYAALRALGFSMGTLRRIVVAQSAWVGGAGLAVGGALTLVLALAAAAGGIPVVLTPTMVAIAAALVMLTALGSGALALRRVAQADPAVLLL